MDTVKTICAECTGETVVNGYCHNCGAGEKPEVEEDTIVTPAPDLIEEII